MNTDKKIFSEMSEEYGFKPLMNNSINMSQTIKLEDCGEITRRVKNRGW